jgi:hypothetical protein
MTSRRKNEYGARWPITWAFLVHGIANSQNTKVMGDRLPANNAD